MEMNRENVSVLMKKRIGKSLEEIEATYHVNILFACESGSRG